MNEESHWHHPSCAVIEKRYDQGIILFKDLMGSGNPMSRVLSNVGEFSKVVLLWSVVENFVHLVCGGGAYYASRIEIDDSGLFIKGKGKNLCPRDAG